MLNNFNGVNFKWSFRKYQQRVLDRASKYLNDGKINIVAAPGSGKTILGLELIIRNGGACIVLYPTSTIKYQWGERFVESFEAKDKDLSSYISYDLHEINLINSITYQALYSSMNKVRVKSDDEDVDYSNIDILELVKKHGITTICLDEAHHLQNEWQKALELFIKSLDKNIKIISLTATPPYDASKAEWERYKSVCGEIDEEIFVPELIKERNLCPHQDYVYFNYPNDEEILRVKKRREVVNKAVEELYKSEVFYKAYKRISLDYQNDNLDLANCQREYEAILVIANHLNYSISPLMIKMVTHRKNLGNYSLDYLLVALEYLIGDNSCLINEEKNNLISLLKKLELIEKGSINLGLDEKLQKELVASSSKLKSINEIVKSEVDCLKDKLRMLILTDYIKRESLKDVNTSKDLNSISIISIFESLRRENKGYKLGVVSGGIVILPVSLTKTLAAYNYSYEIINGSEYAEFKFKGSNKDKVDIVSKLFEEGYINILVGTKSLLGEGWDSPCINSLILASYVGSFMLSNQMRGRAIRTYKGEPNKVSNIWHLVSLEPDYDSEDEKFMSIDSQDFKTLKRRFECFVGPCYDEVGIENGIERIIGNEDLNKIESVEKLNNLTLLKSKNREEVSNDWDEALKNSSELVSVARLGKDYAIKSSAYLDKMSLFIEILCLFASLILTITISSLIAKICFSILTIVIVLVMLISNGSFLLHLNKKKNLYYLILSLLETVKKAKLVDDKAKLRIVEKDEFFEVGVTNCSVHNQSVFNGILEEFLSPFNKNKYVYVMGKRRMFIYEYAYPCPSEFNKNKNLVSNLNRNLNNDVGSFKTISKTNSRLKGSFEYCKKKSYLNFIKEKISYKQRIWQDDEDRKRGDYR